MQANTKTIEGRQHPDRDAQYCYINERVDEFLAAGQPVISVDTRKKENVGRYANGGAEYQRKGEPEKTNTYDFIGELGMAVPYGVYDVVANAGWVSVGTDADTGEFAVESIRRWWAKIGVMAYPEATRLLISADGGGSNGARLRLWKTQSAQLATETGLEITVEHLPPGTSKWNKILGRVRNPVVLGHTRVVQPDDEIVAGVQGPATLRLAERRRTATASIRVDEFLTARAPPIGGHGVLPSTRSNETARRSRVNPVNVLWSTH